MQVEKYYDTEAVVTTSEGSISKLGTFSDTVTYTATVLAGNTTTLTINHTIIDSIDPTFTITSTVVTDLTVEFKINCRVSFKARPDDVDTGSSSTENITFTHTETVYEIVLTDASARQTSQRVNEDTTPPTYTLNITKESFYRIGGGVDATVTFEFTNLLETVAIEIIEISISGIPTGETKIDATGITTNTVSYDKEFSIKVKDTLENTSQEVETVSYPPKLNVSYGGTTNTYEVTADGDVEYLVVGGSGIVIIRYPVTV